eukprot:9869118-Heterocapsa_arctica.AAC.1
MHKREKTNKNNARQVNIDVETEFTDKSDTEDNCIGDLRPNEEKDRSSKEESEIINDKSDSEDQSVVESNITIVWNSLDKKK